MSHIHTHEDGGVATGMILGIVVALLVAVLVIFLFFGGFGIRGSDNTNNLAPGGNGTGTGGDTGGSAPSSMRYIVPEYALTLR
jgi:hypothetical protein